MLGWLIDNSLILDRLGAWPGAKQSLKWVWTPTNHPPQTDWLTRIGQKGDNLALKIHYSTGIWLSKPLIGKELGSQISLLDILPKPITFDLSLVSSSCFFLLLFFCQTDWQKKKQTDKHRDVQMLSRFATGKQVLQFLSYFWHFFIWFLTIDSYLQPFCLFLPILYDFKSLSTMLLIFQQVKKFWNLF